jgi:spore coat polysaccharide biosynthesis protein SpsF (cytidylyltransferase family)
MEIKRYKPGLSTRLPGKVLKEINGKSLLQIHFTLKKCVVSGNIVATTTNEEDAIIYGKVIEWGFNAQGLGIGRA